MNNKLRDLEERIKYQKQNNIRQFEKELAENGCYEKWYADLAEFRKSLQKYYKYSMGG